MSAALTKNARHDGKANTSTQGMADKAVSTEGKKVPSASSECDNKKGGDKNADMIQEANALIGKSWFHAEQERRQQTGRLSLTRVLLVASVNDGFPPSSSGPCETSGRQQEANHTVAAIARGLQDALFHFEYPPGLDPEKVEDRVTGGFVVLSSETGGAGRDHDGISDDEEQERTTTTGAAILGFIEGPEDGTNELLKVLHQTTSATILVSSFRIVSLSHDCPSRNFPSPKTLEVFTCNRSTDERAGTMSSVQTRRRGRNDHPDGGCVTTDGGHIHVARDMLMSLCHGSSDFPILEVPSAETASATPGKGRSIPPLEGRAKKAIPSMERIRACADCNKFPMLEEYLDIYCAPFFVGECDRIFPPQPVVDYSQRKDLFPPVSPVQGGSDVETIE